MEIGPIAGIHPPARLERTSELNKDVEITSRVEEIKRLGDEYRSNKNDQDQQRKLVDEALIDEQEDSESSRNWTASPYDSASQQIKVPGSKICYFV